jgi:GMP synthase (glutamine-hydrolysing)
VAASPVVVLPIVVLVAGDPVPTVRAVRGGFFDLIRAAAPGFAAVPWLAYDLRERDVLPALTDALAVIVTGSASSVTEGLPWMQRAAEQLRELVALQLPLLGICFGHQLLGHALGGSVRTNPLGREIGSVNLTLASSDPVFGEAGAVCVNSTHVDALLELPPGARVLGSTALDRYAAVRFAESAWGVQFHPEIDAEIMRHYLDVRRPALVDEGRDVDALLRAARDTPAGAAIIQRFLGVAQAQRSAVG